MLWLMLWAVDLPKGSQGATRSLGPPFREAEAACRGVVGVAVVEAAVSATVVSGTGTVVTGGARGMGQPRPTASSSLRRISRPVSSANWAR